jgi:hypothetical protein
MDVVTISNAIKAVDDAIDTRAATNVNVDIDTRFW